MVNVHYLADQLEAHLRGRAGTRPEIRHLRRARQSRSTRAAAPRRRCALLGPGPFFIHNSDSVWSEGVDARAAGDAAPVGSRHAWTACFCSRRSSTSLGYGGKGDFAMAPDGRLTPPGRAAGGALCLRRRRRCARPVCSTARPRAAFSLNLLWDRALKARPPLWHAPRRPLDACRHAGGARRGRVSGSRGKVPDGTTVAPAALHHPALGAVPHRRLPAPCSTAICRSRAAPTRPAHAAACHHLPADTARGARLAGRLPRRIGRRALYCFPASTRSAIPTRTRR